MNKSQAKKIALGVLAGECEFTLADALSSSLDVVEIEHEDMDKIDAAFKELAIEFNRRAGLASSPITPNMAYHAVMDN